jgi:hypothetical protein
LNKKVISICSDSGPNIVAGIEVLLTLHDDLKDIIHIRCACHVINLAVKEGLKGELDAALVKLRFFVKKVHSASKLRQQLKDICKANDEPEIQVVMPVENRWNSDLAMIQVAIRIEISLTEMSENINQELVQTQSKKKKSSNSNESVVEDEALSPLSSDDWDDYRLCLNLLEPFNQGNVLF